MGNGAVSNAGSAVNGDTTSPSAKARMIQSVGVHLLWLVRELPPVVEQDGGGDEWRVPSYGYVWIGASVC